MDSLVFFGSLRSKKLLKNIIKCELDHLIFHDAKILKTKLFKVKNENFPYLEKMNSNNNIVNCTYIKGFTEQDLKRIIFYESIEYKISKINIVFDKKIVETNFFELIKKHKTLEEWSFNRWQIEFEELSCIAAKEWMSLYEEYKNDSSRAEVYWQKMIKNAKIKIKE
jgi:hypothetical protein